MGAADDGKFMEMCNKKVGPIKSSRLPFTCTQWSHITGFFVKDFNFSRLIEHTHVMFHLGIRDRWVSFLHQNCLKCFRTSLLFVFIYFRVALWRSTECADYHWAQGKWTHSDFFTWQVCWRMDVKLTLVSVINTWRKWPMSAGSVPLKSRSC